MGFGFVEVAFVSFLQTVCMFSRFIIRLCFVVSLDGSLDIPNPSSLSNFM